VRCAQTSSEHLESLDESRDPLPPESVRRPELAGQELLPLPCTRRPAQIVCPKTHGCPLAVCGLGRPFRGVWCPSTLTEAGSDQHRVYLTRLCSASRFFRPLDALLHLQPFRPCFMPVTPLGFDLQRFSLPGSGPRLSTKPVLLAVLGDRNPRPPGVRFIGLRLRGFAHPESPFRTGRCYPVTAGRSSPGLHPLRGVPPRGLGLCRHRPPLMGFDTALDDRNRPSLCLLSRVSKNHEIGWSLFETADLHEVCRPQ